MFLVEYRKGMFVDAEKITIVNKNNGVSFCILGENESDHKVEKECEYTFLNNIQAMNKNITNVQD